MRLRNKLGATILAVVLLGAGAVPAAAQKSADTLRIVMRDALPNVDPFFNNLRTGVVMHRQLGRAGLPQSGYVQARAAARNRVEVSGSDHDRVHAAPGVKFHDGSPFTADDVVYTINLVADPASHMSTPSNYNWIEKAEKTGDLSVRVRVEAAEPARWNISRWCCQSTAKAYREKVGAEGYAKAPVRTAPGPYKMTKVEPGVSIDFEPFEDLLGRQPQGQACDRG